MKRLDDVLSLAEEPIEVKPPRSKSSIFLRYPSFAEWHDLSVSHRSLKGVDPSAELIARTVAVVLCDARGKRQYADGDVGQLLEASPRSLMWIYVKAWETVLRNDEQAVRDEEEK